LAKGCYANIVVDEETCCECEEGTLFDGEKCVDTSECPCIDANGKVQLAILAALLLLHVLFRHCQRQCSGNEFCSIAFNHLLHLNQRVGISLALHFAAIDALHFKMPAIITASSCKRWHCSVDLAHTPSNSLQVRYGNLNKSG